jgi:hypothetical protein
MSSSTGPQGHLTSAELDALAAGDAANIDPSSPVAAHMQHCVCCLGDFIVRLVAAHPGEDAALRFNAPDAAAEKVEP